MRISFTAIRRAANDRAYPSERAGTTAAVWEVMKERHETEEDDNEEKDNKKTNITDDETRRYLLCQCCARSVDWRRGQHSESGKR